MEPDDARRRAEELADPAALEEALRAERARVAEPIARPPPAPPRPIGIYCPAIEDGERCFVRPPPSRFGDHHAAPRTLARKRALLPLRIVFLGESVAAGYLLAPHLTPAQVLAQQLAGLAGPGQFEVIDLARTNETIASLVETLEASVQINPDMFVIMAGNNWDLLETPEVSPFAPRTQDRQAFGEAFVDGGAPAVQAMASDRLDAIARRAFAHVDAIARAIGVPVIVVMPEVNLADWETREPPLWLPADGNDRWFELLGQARRALARGAPDVVHAIVQQLTALDHGLCATTHRLAARAHASVGDDSLAAVAARAEIDAARYPRLCHLGAPRATTDTHRRLLDAGRSDHVTLVDLRNVFAAHTGTPYAGERMFFDYCHLTREGIKVAMAAVAAAAFSASGLGTISWQDALARAPEPALPADADAVATLGAAIHTAHRLVALDDDRPSLRRWCDRALAASPAIAAAMVGLADARLSRCPVALTAWQRSIASSPIVLGHAHGLAFDHVDAELLLAMAGALAARGLPSWSAPRLDRELELARAPFLWHAAARFYPDAMAEGATTVLRSPWPELDLAIVGAGDLELDLTARLPAPDDAPRHGPITVAPRHGPITVAPRHGPITVAVGDRLVGRFDAGPRWTRARLRVDAVTGPITRLRLIFPPLGRTGDAALATIRHRLLLGQPTPLHPVFGELFSLRIRPR